MKRNTKIAAGIGGVGLLAALYHGCSDEDPSTEGAPEAPRAGEIAPLELTDNAARERISKALELTQTADPENPPEFTVTADDATFPESLGEEIALAVEASAFQLASTLGGALTGAYYVPAEVTYREEAILGFTMDGKIFVTPPFFNTSRQDDARQAAALATLAACRGSTTCEVYNGPSTPSLPPNVQKAARQTYETAYKILEIPEPSGGQSF